MVIASDSAMDTAKTEAIESVNRIADEIAAEANIETLVMAKGFEDCVAVISDGSASVVVKTNGLLPSEIAQIMEIEEKYPNVKLVIKNSYHNFYCVICCFIIFNLPPIDRPCFSSYLCFSPCCNIFHSSTYIIRKKHLMTLELVGHC